MTKTRESQTARTSELPASSDRRQSRRLRLELETAVPVLVRSTNGTQWGLARNVSEGGMLIELREPPPIGAEVEIKLFGVQGSIDAPDAVFVRGEVRHNVAWNFAQNEAGPRNRPGMSGIGVRFCEPAPAPVETVPGLFVKGSTAGN
ncbi:MAG: PilZ domain-containing protein [Myxococcota bacterium]